jgi:FAD/FMN-containing dehydrogenase
MTADWGALQRTIDGDVVLPGAPDYESVRQPVMARFEHLRPAAVVRCVTPVDVAATLAVAGALGLGTAIRSGGHSVAGRSATDGVVLDVTPMGSVAVAGEVATVGAGVRLGDLYDALATHGLTIPAGCGPSVGIAGLTLGGGLGILGRKHGLTCDHLLGAQVVLADGRVVDCDEHHDGELFWALRGAGGGHFGVVTSLVFRTLAAPAPTVFQLTWPPAAAAAVVQAWQAWAPEGPDELDATLRLTAGDDQRPPGVEVVGTVLDGEADAPRSSASWSTVWGWTRWRHRAGTWSTGRPSGTSRGWDRSRISPSGPVRSSQRSRATSTPSQSFSADPCRARRWRR